MKYNKHDEADIVKFLRWRRLKPCDAHETYMTYKNIAAFVNRS